MNNEQKLEVIRAALEMGAEVELSLHSSPEVDKRAALDNLAKLLGNKDFFTVKQKDSWYEASEPGIRIYQFWWNQQYMIEDINFEGVEEHEPIGESAR